MSSRSKEAFFERLLWICVMVVAAIFGLFGIGDVILGMNADPAIAESLTGIAWEDLQASSPETANLSHPSGRSLGSSILSPSILSMAITLTAFRPGERWAWYALLIWPLWNAAVLILFFTAKRHPDFSPPPPMLSAPVFFSITALALGLSYRKFLPRA